MSFLKSTMTTAEEFNRQVLATKCAWIAAAFCAWFILGALVVGLAGLVTSGLGSAADARFQKMAQAYDAMAEDEPNPQQALVYRQAAELYRSTDGEFGRAATATTQDYPTWQEGGLMGGGFMATVFLLGYLLAAIIDAFASRLRRTA